MPRHANHQAAVVAPVRGPPVLAVGHERGQVVLQCRHIELFDFFAVIEVCPHGVGLGVVLVQDVQIEGLGPPSHGRVAHLGVGAVHDGA